MTAVSTHAALPPGTLFAQDFRIVRLLGEGGMGAVYAAEQLSTGVERALKVMRADLLDDARYRERFAREARHAAQIDSDHVAQVLAAGVDAATGLPWLAMELLRGETLLAAVARRGPLPDAEVREIFRELGHALGLAHAHNLVHRDIKPENVFLATPRRPGVAFTVKLLDFGIAKLVQDAQAAASAKGRTTGVLGSPLWMAPEQANGGAISPATDVWAMGLLAFYLWTGRSYWKAAGAGPLGMDVAVQTVLAEFLLAPLETATARASRYGCAAGLPPGVDRWFARCVVREVEQRYRDAREAVDALLTLPPAAAPEPSRDPGAAWAAMAQPTGPGVTDAAAATGSAPGAHATARGSIPPTLATPMPSVETSPRGAAPGAVHAGAPFTPAPPTAPSGSAGLPRTLATMDSRELAPAAAMFAAATPTPPPAHAPLAPAPSASYSSPAHAPPAHAPGSYAPGSYAPPHASAPPAPLASTRPAPAAAAPLASTAYAPPPGPFGPAPGPFQPVPPTVARQIAAPSAAPPVRRRRWLVWTLLAVVLLGGLVVAGVALYLAYVDDDDSDGPPAPAQPAPWPAPGSPTPSGYGPAPGYAPPPTAGAPR